MPVSTGYQTANQTRLAIDSLWEKLVTGEAPFTGIGELDSNDEELQEYGIERIPFDFEALLDSSQAVNLSFEPPVLFHPLPRSTLQSFPINMEKVQKNESLTQIIDALDDIPEVEEDYRDSSRGIWKYLSAYSGRGFPRDGIPRGHLNLRDFLGIVQIGTPNIFLHVGRPFFDRSTYTGWRTGTKLEYPRGDNNVPVHSHLTLMMMQSCIGKEGSMLIGELAPVVSAMRKRAYQPLVSMEGRGRAFRDGRLESPRRYVGDHQPVAACLLRKSRDSRSYLCLSWDPDTGGFFYSCMNGPTLVIRQSKLYSFERKDTAPWEFFSRLILSSPLEELSSK